MAQYSKTLAFLAVAASLSCGVDVTAPEMVGDWGGEHIMLTLTLIGGTVEYDCAHGTIAESIAPANDGRFTTSGVHVLEHGGPVRVDEAPDEHPAVYTGWTDGNRMTLTVTLTDTGAVLGPFELRLDGQALLLKCL